MAGRQKTGTLCHTREILGAEEMKEVWADQARSGSAPPIARLRGTRDPQVRVIHRLSLACSGTWEKARGTGARRMIEPLPAEEGEVEPQ